MMVDTDGSILPCYCGFGTMSMGNIYQDSFSKIWNSPAYKQFRKAVNNNDNTIFPYCTVCNDRFGHGSEEAHRTGETWFQYINVSDAEKKRLKEVWKR